MSRDLISQHDEFLMLLDDDGAIVATSFRSHYSALRSHYSALYSRRAFCHWLTFSFTRLPVDIRNPLSFTEPTHRPVNMCI